MHEALSSVFSITHTHTYACMHTVWGNYCLIFMLFSNHYVFIHKHHCTLLMLTPLLPWLLPSIPSKVSLLFPLATKLHIWITFKFEPQRFSQLRFKELSKACLPGPRIKPKAWHVLVLAMALVLSWREVAPAMYDRTTATFPRETVTSKGIIHQPWYSPAWLDTEQEILINTMVTSSSVPS